ncbi:hypothetical protein DL240_01815 [Lujinxingia litoralis]|uniref:VWFA domain-containing protein n=1 Tax=Lujinxingia litoralis TaxID=2211119 RepID=A0A328CA24_9DELT|nr:hypothetical protein [Lujinxingia litoralis]RAL24972.1 hypothetical protein DL240_01815 [Lujinxingia litoralis]
MKKTSFGRNYLALALALVLWTPACSDPDGEGQVPDTDIEHPDAGDAGPDSDVEPDVEDPDTEEPDVDGGGEPDVEEVDYCEPGGEGWQRDADQDGLSDCEERELCTDEFDHDSDGDTLSDLEELQLGTDPCAADSDADGVNDDEEELLKLDPLNVCSYPAHYYPNPEACRDGDLWVVSACDEPASEPTEFFVNGVGNWGVGLPPAFANYTNLTISGASVENRQAAAVFDDPANEVAGFILSQSTDGVSSAVQAVQLKRQLIGSVSTVVQEVIGGEFSTHDYNSAAVSRYLLRSPQPRSARAMRDHLLAGVAPFGSGDISGLPSTSGNTYTEYRVYLTTVLRQHQLITLVALAPDTKYESQDKTKFRMDDLTNTTGLATATAADVLRCTRFPPVEEIPQVEFLWVLDQSGSMSDDFDRVRDVAEGFFAELRNTPLDYRLGVTNMWQGGQGELRNPPGWHRDQASFLEEIEEWVVACNGCSGDFGGAEYGIKNARSAIEYMSSNLAPAELRIRPNAEIVTVLMSDEEAQTFQNSGLNTPAGQALMNDFIGFFTGRTTMFSIVTNDGEAYRQVATATGGNYYSLDSPNIEESINDIIIAATGRAANYVLPDVPLSSSLRVFKDGQWVPRSRINGFDYFAATNSIAFFGEYRPSDDDPEDAPINFVAVSYRHFQVNSKPDSNPQ